MSNETSWGVTQFVAAAERSGLPKIVSIQNSYHLLNRGPFETDLVEARSTAQSIAVPRSITKPYGQRR